MSSPKAQQESRKRVLTLEVAGGGRTFDFSNRELKMVPGEDPQIKLHFLRFGLFSEAEKSKVVSAKAQTLPENEEPVVEGMYGELYTTEKGATQTLDEVIVLDPKLENFSYARTGLKAGYLYIMDEADPENPTEYEIGEGGSFRSVSWEKKADVRETDGKLNTNGFHIAEYEAVLWVAYSPIQWSVDFYDRLKNDTADRRLYMKKVVCTGFKEGEEEVQGDYMPVDKATAYFSQADSSLARSLASRMDALQCQEQSDKEEQQEKRPEKEFIRPDMFITLNDPLNNLFELSNALAEKTLEFRALIDAIQSGETLQAARQRLENGNDTPPEPDENYASLFSLALTSYLMVYGDEDSKKKYDGGVTGWHDGKKERGTDFDSKKAARSSHYDPDADKKGWTGGLDLAKVEAILGYEDRQKFRKIVQGYRNDYAIFVGSKSCKEHLEYYLHNHPERTLYGCHTLFDTLMAFYPNPHNWDRHLLLKKDYKKEDALQDWVYKLTDDEKKYTATLADEQAVNSKAPTYEGTDALYALLTEPLEMEKPLEENNPLKYSLAVAGVAKAMFQACSDEVYNTRTVKGKKYKTIKAKHTFVKNKINKKFKLDKNLVKMKGNQMHLNPEVFTKHASIDWEAVSKNQYTGGKKKVLEILKRYDGLVYIGKKNGKHVFEIPYEKSGDKLSKSEVRKNALNKKAAVVLNSRAFNGTIAFLQVLNMKGAFEDVIKDGNFRTRINFVGVSAELTEAVLTLQQIRLETINGGQTRLLTNSIRVVGAIGGAVSAALCFYDSLQAFNKRDNDAGLALFGAGVAFGYAVYIGLGVSTGPIGWIVLAIGVGLLLLADWLKDTPLEYYFKNFLLSDGERLPRKASESPMGFNRRLYARRKDMVLDLEDRKTLMNPDDAEAALFDALVCKEVHFESIAPEKVGEKIFKNGDIGGGGDIKVTTSKTHMLKASFTFFQLFSDKEQFVHRVFLFPFGIKKGKNWEITNTQDLSNIKSGNLSTGVAITFEIPKIYAHHVDYSSEIVLAVQLKLDKEGDKRFPYPIGKEKDRYLAARIGLTNIHINKVSHDKIKELIILPASELLDYKKWKK